MQVTGFILSVLSLQLVFIACLGETVVTDDVVLNTEDDAAMVELLQLLTSVSGEDAQTPDVGIHGDQETVSMEMSDAVPKDVNLDLQALMKGCSQGRCKFCTRAKWFKACVEASILKLGFEVKVSLNGITIYRKQISINNPPPFCVNKIPGLSRIADVCLEIYDVDLANKKACVKITFKIKISKIQKKIKIKLGCFKIRHATLPEFAMDQASDNSEEALTLDGSP